MKRKIVRIDESKCTGCGLCARVCHEGAIRIIDGVARLISDVYCDGLGDCLPACPEGAIAIIEREAAPYDEAAVKANSEAARGATADSDCGHDTLACGCPGTQVRSLDRHERAGEHGRPAGEGESAGAEAAHRHDSAAYHCHAAASELRQWPCQIQLVPANAPFLRGADLLIAADCTAYAYANFHADFMRGRVTLVGCPKLDGIDYAGKLAEIMRANDVRSITVARMEVPCCSGLVNMVKRAMLDAGALVPWHIVTIAADGSIVERS